MKKITNILVLSALFLNFISCNSDRTVEATNESNHHVINSKKQTVLYNNQKFELLEDNSVAFYDNKNNYIGDIIINSENIILENNINQKNTNNEQEEYIIKNNDTGEFITLKNIKNTDNKTVFDAETSSGLILNNLEWYHQDNINNKLPIVPIIRAVVTVVAIIAVTTSSGGTQSDCMKSMPTSCGGGQSPYAEYTSGWFESTCKVGCR